MLDHAKQRRGGMMSVTEDTAMILTRKGMEPGGPDEGWAPTGEVLEFAIGEAKFDGHMFERLLDPGPDDIVKVDL